MSPLPLIVKFLHWHCELVRPSQWLTSPDDHVLAIPQVFPVVLSITPLAPGLLTIHSAS